MTAKQAKGRVQSLVKQLNQYSYEYHVLDSPTVSDAVYDGLMQELKNIEHDFPELITPAISDSKSGWFTFIWIQKSRSFKKNA